MTQGRLYLRIFIESHVCLHAWRQLDVGDLIDSFAELKCRKQDIWHASRNKIDLMDCNQGVFIV